MEFKIFLLFLTLMVVPHGLGQSSDIEVSIGTSPSDFNGEFSNNELTLYPNEGFTLFAENVEEEETYELTLERSEDDEEVYSQDITFSEMEEYENVKKASIQDGEYNLEEETYTVDISHPEQGISVENSPSIEFSGKLVSVSLGDATSEFNGEFQNPPEDHVIAPTDGLVVFTENIDEDKDYNIVFDDSEGSDYTREAEFKELSSHENVYAEYLSQDETFNLDSGSYNITINHPEERIKTVDEPLLEISNRSIQFSNEGVSEVNNELHVSPEAEFIIAFENVDASDEYNVTLMRGENEVYASANVEIKSQRYDSNLKVRRYIEISTRKPNKFGKELEEGSYGIRLIKDGEELSRVEKSLVVAEPVSGRFGYPSGLKEWNHHRYLSDVSREEAAALSAVDINFVSQDFGPISTSKNMTAGKIVNETRAHAIDEGWINEINDERIARYEVSGSYYVSPYTKNRLTPSTPNRDPYVEETPGSDMKYSNYENVTREDDCYTNLDYRPREHSDIPTEDRSNRGDYPPAAQEPYDCPSLVSEVSGSIFPSDIEAKDFCHPSMTEDQCIDHKITPTCENVDNPGFVCQAILTDTVSGSEDFGPWRSYCNQNFNEGGIKLNTSEVVNCMTGCYGYNGVADDGSFRKAPEASTSNYLTCGEVVQSFCEDTRYASYVSETTETHDRNTCRITG